MSRLQYRGIPCRERISIFSSVLGVLHDVHLAPEAEPFQGSEVIALQPRVGSVLAGLANPGLEGAIPSGLARICRCSKTEMLPHVESATNLPWFWGSRRNRDYFLAQGHQLVSGTSRNFRSSLYLFFARRRSRGSE